MKYLYVFFILEDLSRGNAIVNAFAVTSLRFQLTINNLSEYCARMYLQFLSKNGPVTASKMKLEDE